MLSAFVLNKILAVQVSDSETSSGEAQRTMPYNQKLITKKFLKNWIEISLYPQNEYLLCYSPASHDLKEEDRSVLTIVSSFVAGVNLTSTRDFE